MVEIKKYNDLDLATKTTLERIIESEFGHIPIVKETQWAQPDWTIVHREEGEIVTFYNIVDREIIVDNVMVRMAGINNVITPVAFRGKGYAFQLLKSAEDLIFDTLKCALGVLLCADDLVSYYEKLGWYQIACPVHFTQTSGEKVWGANAMLLSRGERILPERVHLNGEPW